MRQVIAVVLGTCVSLTAFALEYFPINIIFVRPEPPAPVVLAVGTPEELATLQFIIVEPPKHGVLLGIPPELIYIPQPSFRGTEWVTFLVQKEGALLDVGTIQLRVMGPMDTISPAFRFEGTLTFSGPAFTWETYNFIFGTYARFQYFDLQALATWTPAGFASFQTVSKIELEGSWPVAWRLPITSTLTFNPSVLSLSSWTLDARTTLLGWNLSWYFFYSGSDPEGSSYSTFTTFGSVEEISVESRIKFATLTPTFAEWFLKLRGPWICENCPIKWELEFLQTKAGFDHLSFLMRDIPTPCFVCGDLKTFLDVKVTFTASSKTLEPALRLVSGLVACLRPFISLVTPENTLGVAGLDVYGVELRCDFSESYKARFATSFDPEKDAAVTGYPQFFEVMQFEGPVTPCCGSPGWWQVFLYFSRTSGKVFGLAMGDVNLYMFISREVIVNVRLQAGLVDPSDPAKSWKLTFGWKSLF